MDQKGGYPPLTPFHNSDIDSVVYFSIKQKSIKFLWHVMDVPVYILRSLDTTIFKNLPSAALFYKMFYHNNHICFFDFRELS